MESAESPSEKEIASQRRYVDESLAALAKNAADALPELPDDELHLLLSLRKTKRRWRLDHRDWMTLAQLLTAPESSETSRAANLRRLVLAIRLRGKLMSVVKGVRRNPFMLDAVAVGAERLPEDDVLLLLNRWTSLPWGADRQVLHRVMRYGRLRDVQGHSSVEQVRMDQDDHVAELCYALK